MLSFALSGLQTTINGYFSLSSEKEALFEPLVGRVVALQFKGLGFTLFCFFSKERMELLRDFPGTPDATLSGTPLGFLAQWRGQKAGKGFSSEDLQLEGDPEVAQCFQRLLTHLDIDWEEHLSRFTGDTVAHTLGNFFRKTKAWKEKTCEKLFHTASDYLLHELHCFVSTPEVDDFLEEVDTLRFDVDRLAQRLQYLQEKIN